MPTTLVASRFFDGTNLEAAASDFALHNRTRIHRVLPDASAQALRRCLLEDVRWSVAFNEGEHNQLIDEREFANLDEATRQSILDAVAMGAGRGFQYLYCSYPMVTAYLARRDPGLLLHELLECLNSPEVLVAVRRISGIESLRKCDAQATWYRPGDFLTRHDDGNRNTEGRRVAYVLNLTEGWRTEWGGMLQFVGASGEVVQTWLPEFNVLALFRVPQLHCVTQVATFATQPRLAVTGWFRDR